MIPHIALCAIRCACDSILGRLVPLADGRLAAATLRDLRALMLCAQVVRLIIIFRSSKSENKFSS